MHPVFPVSVPTVRPHLQEGGSHPEGTAVQPKVKAGRLNLILRERSVGDDGTPAGKLPDLKVRKHAVALCVHCARLSRSNSTAECRFIWSGQRDLNSRPFAPQTNALTWLRYGPTERNPY